MSLQSERQAIAASVAQSRQSSGKQLSDDLNRLVKPTQPSRQLPAVAKRGSLPAQQGVGTYKQPAATGTGGGIASPLTEGDISKREYWPEGVLSSDGLFSMPAIKKMLLTDSNGDTVVINLAEPPKP